MSKLIYSIQPSSRTSLTVSVHEPQTVRFDNQQVPVEEVVSLLLCSGMTQPQVLDWLERRMQVGRFATEVIQ